MQGKVEICGAAKLKNTMFLLGALVLRSKLQLLKVRMPKVLIAPADAIVSMIFVPLNPEAKLKSTLLKVM